MKKVLFILILFTLPVWGQIDTSKTYKMRIDAKKITGSTIAPKGYIKSVDWDNTTATFMPSYGMKVKLDSNWNIAIANCLLNLLKEYKADFDKVTKDSLKTLDSLAVTFRQDNKMIVFDDDTVRPYSKHGGGMRIIKVDAYLYECREDYLNGRKEQFNSLIGFISWLERKTKINKK